MAKDSKRESLALIKNAKKLVTKGDLETSLALLIRAKNHLKDVDKKDSTGQRMKKIVNRRIKQIMADFRNEASNV